MGSSVGGLLGLRCHVGRRQIRAGGTAGHPVGEMGSDGLIIGETRVAVHRPPGQMEAPNHGAPGRRAAGAGFPSCGLYVWPSCRACVPPLLVRPSGRSRGPVAPQAPKPVGGRCPASHQADPTSVKWNPQYVLNPYRSVDSIGNKIQPSDQSPLRIAKKIVCQGGVPRASPHPSILHPAPPRAFTTAATYGYADVVQQEGPAAARQGPVFAGSSC